MTTLEADHAALGGLLVYWNPNDPDRIHLYTDRPDIVGDAGDETGLRIVFSRSAESKDYQQENFNRLASWLRLMGRAAPTQGNDHGTVINTP